MLPLETYRRWATELVEYACGYSGGRGEDDPVYQAVTEGRDRGTMQRRYSSCGDLAMWMLYRLGVRSSWVNRDEHRGWTSGINVSRLVFDAPALVAPGIQEHYLPGDIGIIWSAADGHDAHVFVILDDQQPHALFVGEYGQPGGALHTRRVGYHGGMLSIGTRALYRVLRLDEVLAAAARERLLVSPENVRTWAARLNLPPPAPSASDTSPPLIDQAEIETLPDNPVQALPTLRRGDKGEDVERLQERLNAFGTTPSLRVDGDFGLRTEGALRSFQRARALKPDGVCGELTWQELNR